MGLSGTNFGPSYPPAGVSSMPFQAGDAKPVAVNSYAPRAPPLVLAAHGG
jgi:hypothetical protein